MPREPTPATCPACAAGPSGVNRHRHRPARRLLPPSRPACRRRPPPARCTAPRRGRARDGRPRRLATGLMAARPLTANDGRRSIQSVETGFPLLAALVESARPMTLRDLAAAAGMTSAKAHPYLVSFVRVGLVQQDPATGQYDLGPFALQMGLVSLQRL